MRKLLGNWFADCSTEITLEPEMYRVQSGLKISQIFSCSIHSGLQLIRSLYGLWSNIRTNIKSGNVRELQLQTSLQTFLFVIILGYGLFSCLWENPLIKCLWFYSAEYFNCVPFWKCSVDRRLLNIHGFAKYRELLFIYSAFLPRSPGPFLVQHFYQLSQLSKLSQFINTTQPTDPLMNV